VYYWCTIRYYSFLITTVGGGEAVGLKVTAGQQLGSCKMDSCWTNELTSKYSGISKKKERKK